MGVVIKASGLRIQRFRCKVCGRTFTELEGTPLEGFHDIRFALVVAYLYLCLGMEPGTITRVTVHLYSTVIRLVTRIKMKKFSKNCLFSLGVTLGTDCYFR